MDQRCDTCGNTYEPMLVIEQRGQRYQFDSFECAIHRMAPACAHCGCRVVGHGVSVGQRVYCCDHCSRQTGEQSPPERAEQGVH